MSMTSRRSSVLLILLICASSRGGAQITNIPNLSVVKVISDPSGACTAGDPLQHNTVNGTLWLCNNSTWAEVSGSSTVSGGSQVLDGCGIEWISGLTFQVGVCSYQIKGAAYLSPLTSVVLTAADPTNPRIDVIGVDVTGAVFTIAGTPAANPAQPVIDASTQLQLTFVTIDAGATTPTNVAAVSIYEEDTEWTSAVSAHFTAASTSNPYRGTKDIEATAAVLTNNVTLTKPAAGTVDLVGYNALVFYLRSKATWPTGGSGANAARTLSVYWRNGSTQKGLQVVVKSGVFGFDSSNISAYQQVSIPTSLFNANGLNVTTLVFQVSGNTGTSSIGFYIDGVSLQSGFGSAVLPTTLMNWKGTWNVTTAYSPYDVVVLNGTGYVALQANTNVVVTTTATWASLTPSAAQRRGFGASFGKCAGTAPSAGEVVYLPELPYACTISAYAISADAGTATIKVWRAADGTAIPAAGGSINTSGVALSSGTRVRSTTVADFTDTTLDLHDVLAVNLFAVATATCVQVFIQCDI